MEPIHATHPFATAKVEQKVLNQSWPLRDRNGEHARGIPDQEPDDCVRVEVRLELEHDGEVVLPGLATRWTDSFSHAYVQVNDPRVGRRGVWLRTRDTRAV